MADLAASDTAGWPLAAWLLAQGGRLAALRPGEGALGRGIFAAARQEVGAPLLRVPASCLLTTAVALRGPAAPFITATWSGRERDHILLAAYLLHARSVVDHPFAPYLATLPDRLPQHPLFFGEAELGLLRGTGFLALLGARRARLREEWRALRRDAAGLPDLDWSDWCWARSLVTSRAFARQSGGAPCLVPIADLLNHSLSPAVEWGFDDDSGDFVMLASQAAAAGCELCDSYGHKSNSRLLLHYGFVLPENPIDECLLELPDGSLHILSPEPRDAEEGSVSAAAAGSLRLTRAKLAALCAMRLAGLAPAEERGPATENARNAVLVRESERRILGSWARLAAGQRAAP